MIEVVDVADVPAKRSSESQVTLHQLMLPQHANAHGNVHGGVIMKLVDEAGGIAAMRHSRRPSVTVAIDSMTVHSPVHVGELLRLDARLSWVGKSSMEVEVLVHAENSLTGDTTYTNSAYLVYVAIDGNGRPVAVPPLLLEGEDEQRRFADGEQRQRERLAWKRRNG